MDESSSLSESYDYLFKFLVIGSAGTGMSNLNPIFRYIFTYLKSHQISLCRQILLIAPIH